MEPEVSGGFVPAQAQNVEVALLRPLTAVEKTYVAPLLAQAERAIRRVFPDQMAAEPTVGWGTVADVQAEMVARRFRNPNGMITEADGEYSYRRDMSFASGRVEVTEDDLERLGISTGGWTVVNPIMQRWGR